MTNNQRKETFREVKDRITREEFVNKLTELGREETIKFFDLGLTNFASLVHFYECENILDSLLRKRGFDQLFNTNFGKGTSNSDLMIQHGFVEVFDSGQTTYMYNNSSIK